MGEGVCTPRTLHPRTLHPRTLHSPVHSTSHTLHCTNLYCANALLHCIFGNHGYSAATKSSPSHSGSKHASAIGCYGDQLVELRATDLVIISISESHRQPSS